jgi:hypothetical protein
MKQEHPVNAQPRQRGLPRALRTDHAANKATATQKKIDFSLDGFLGAIGQRKSEALSASLNNHLTLA